MRKFNLNVTRSQPPTRRCAVRVRVRVRVHVRVHVCVRVLTAQVKNQPGTNPQQTKP
jgi:hypothetical protein